MTKQSEMTDDGTGPINMLQLVEAASQRVIVPVGDPLFDLIPVAYPLPCGQHAMVPLGMIPEKLRSLYKLKYS